MNDKPVVLIDVDGVLADFVLGFREIANRRFGVPVYDTHHQESWEFGDLTAKQAAEVWKEIRESKTFWNDLPRLCTLAELGAINRLRERARVVFLTSRVGATALPQTYDWLQSLGIMLPDVWVVSHASEKAGVAKQLGAVVSIEDNLENAIAIGEHCRSVLINRPYNRGNPQSMELPPTVNTVTEFLQQYTIPMELEAWAKAKEVMRDMPLTDRDGMEAVVVPDDCGYNKEEAELWWPMRRLAHEMQESGAKLMRYAMEGKAGRVVRREMEATPGVVVGRPTVQHTMVGCVPTDPTETITAEAERLVNGDRGHDYGPPAEDFARVARFWSAILCCDVTARQVGLCMIGLKLSRECHRHKRDSLVDICGYALTVEKIEEGEA